MSDTRRWSIRRCGALLTTSAVTAALLMTTSSQASAFPSGTSGFFQSGCEFSHALPDDPIVSPGQSGASHLHDFFGNTTTNADSTYESLQAGNTTCDRGQDKAAYWVPALYQDGKRIPPGAMAAYYRGSEKDPGQLRAMPANLRIIAGNPTNTDPSRSVAKWTCDPGFVVDPQQGCPFGSKLAVSIVFPDCWDGVNLDSPDHRSHMTYAKSTAGMRVCPASHPVAVPTLDLKISYPGAQGGAGWSVSSGSPASMHADFFNAWDQPTLQSLVDTCIKSGVGLGTGLVC